MTLTNGTQIPVKGTLLEQPPTQGSGGELNSVWVVDLGGAGLAAGASVDLQLAFGIMRGGSFRYSLSIETLNSNDQATQGASAANVPRDGHQTLTYDAATNRITTEGYEYDAAGNQTRTKRPDGSWQRFKVDPKIKTKKMPCLRWGLLLS